MRHRYLSVNDALGQALRPVIIRNWRVTLPDGTDEQVGQLADRTVLYARGAELTRLAVYDGDEFAAHADLYVDRVDHIAQFENLVTHNDFRCRGYGDALIRDALRRAPFRHAVALSLPVSQIAGLRALRGG